MKLRVEVPLVHHLGRGNLAGDRPARHAVVLLRHCDRVALASENHLCATGEVVGRLGAEREGIEAPVHADETNKAAVFRIPAENILMVVCLAVAHRDHERVLSLPEGDQNRKIPRHSIDSHRHHRGHAVLAFIICGAASKFDLGIDDVIVNTECLCRPRSDENRVVPGDLGDRVGKFLKPAVVDPAAIVDGVIRSEDEVEVVQARRDRDGPRDIRSGISSQSRSRGRI